MKRFLLVIFTLISISVFAQSETFKVKEGSFHHVQGCVTIPAHTDQNNLPMGVIKIIPDNINEQQRTRLSFEGNLAMGIEVEQHEGETWVYVTARAATFLRIKHPDFGVTEFNIPMEIEANKCYEMTLQYVDSRPEFSFLAISSEPAEADIYIDGSHYGKTSNVITDLAVGTHELQLKKDGYVTLTKTFVTTKGETLKLNETLQAIVNKKTYLIVKTDQPNARIYIDDNLISTQEASMTVNVGTTHTYRIECNMYHEESGSVTIEDRTVVDKKLRPAFGYLDIATTPEQGAKAFVDGDYVGITPIKTDKIKSGTHTVMVMKDMYKMKEQSFTVADGQTTNATLNMSANFVTLTLTVDSDSDIYVDEEYKGKGRWTGRLSDGAHIFEARKASHKPSRKSMDLALGENKTITLDAPTPINGTIDVDSSPMGATIYIDGKNYGETPNYISGILIGEHELKLTKQGCAEVKKTINIKEGETLTINEKLQTGKAINEKLQTGKEISISTDQSGDKIYVDGNYVGISPTTSNLAYGTHEIKAERNGKTVAKTINVAQSGGDSSVKLTFKQEINGYEYVDLGLSVKWATCNVGADSPEDYGNHYAWGETTTKDTYDNENCSTWGLSIYQLQSQGYIDGDGNLSPSHDAATANWGGSWRMPTKWEMQELIDNCTWTWTTQNGVNGYKVTSKTNNNYIFLPAAGCRDGSSLIDAGDGGHYWGSTPYGRYTYNSSGLFFHGVNHFVYWEHRYYGLSVRPVSE